jgi:hypothetical protein
MCQSFDLFVNGGDGLKVCCFPGDDVTALAGFDPDFSSLSGCIYLAQTGEQTPGGNFAVAILGDRCLCRAYP